MAPGERDSSDDHEHESGERDLSGAVSGRARGDEGRVENPGCDRNGDQRIESAMLVAKPNKSRGEPDREDGQRGRDRSSREPLENDERGQLQAKDVGRAPLKPALFNALQARERRREG